MVQFSMIGPTPRTINDGIKRYMKVERSMISYAYRTTQARVDPGRAQAGLVTGKSVWLVIRLHCWHAKGRRKVLEYSFVIAGRSVVRMIVTEFLERKPCSEGLGLILTTSHK